MVDEDAVEPVADGALHDGRGHGGVDAAGQAADGQAAVADLLAHPLDLLLGDVEHRPGLAAAGDLVEEVLEHLLAVLGVQHLGVPLHAGEAAVDVLERGDRGDVGRGQDGEALGRLRDRVAVRHPHLVLRRDALEEGAGLGDGDGRTSVLARAGVGDLAAEALGHELEAVAHAEDRDARGEDAGVDAGGVLGVDARRAAGQDDRLRLARQHLGDRHGVGHDLGVDPRLAHAPRDELGVLRPEVDDEDQVVLCRLRHARSLSTGGRGAGRGRPAPKSPQGPIGERGRSTGPRPGHHSKSPQGPIGEGG